MWYFRILFPSTSASQPPTHVRSSHMSNNISLRNSINHISLGKFESISIHKRSNSVYDMANFSVQFGFVLNLPRSNSTFPSIRKRFTRPSRNSIPQNLPRLLEMKFNFMWAKDMSFFSRDSTCLLTCRTKKIFSVVMTMRPNTYCAW